MKNTFCLILFLTFNSLFSQISFNEIIIDSSKVRINAYNGLIVTEKSVFHSDLDNDGDNDLILRSYPIIWFENTDGQGNFSAAQVIDADMSARDMAIADFDNDGDNDIALIGRTSSTAVLGWYENTDGSGSFSDLNTIQSLSISSEHTISVGDVNNDSLLDIVIVNYDIDNETITLFNNNSGNFSNGIALENITTGFSTFKHIIRLTDLDNDGDLDIVYNSTFGLGLLENLDGLGNFSSTQILINDTSISTFFEFGDINNDGLLDLLCNYGFSNTIEVFVNNTSGGFTSLTTPSFFGSIGFRSFFTDFDNDSDLDIISVAFSSNIPGNGSTYERSFIWYENTDGQGNFSDNQLIKEVNINTALFNYALADVNSDGNKDIIATNLDGYELSWNEKIQSSLTVSDSKLILNNLLGVTDIKLIDLDGDDDQDIIYTNRDKDLLGWMENLDAQGTYSEKRVISVKGNDFGIFELTDIDNDNDLDIVCSSIIDDSLRIFKFSQSLNEFIEHQIIDISTPSSGSVTNISNLRLADINNDGRVDIIYHNDDSESILWHQNLNANGDFGPSQTIQSNLANIRFEFIDFDNDGDDDILINDPFSWLENTDGNGNYAGIQNIPNEFDDIFRLLIFDIDGDGDEDILVSGRDFNIFEIGWFENNNNSDFSSYNLIDTLRSSEMTFIDIDNNGGLDIVIENSHPNTPDVADLYYYKNLNGVFSNKILLKENSKNINRLIAGDINNDGRNDILTSTSRGSFGQISWFENLGFLENEISGSVFYDIDQNGCDPNDIPIANAFVGSGGNGLGYYFVTFTDSNGNYSLTVSEGTLETQVIPNSSNFVNTTITPDSHSSTFVGEGGTDTNKDFCVELASASSDLQLNIYPTLNDPKPGLDTGYQIVYFNAGTTQLDGTINFVYDDTKIDFLSASETISSETTNTINFSFSNLNPFEIRTINLVFDVFQPPTTNINDVLLNTATITSNSTEDNPDDNTFILEQTVVGSYVSNNIQVLEGNQILAEDTDEYLHYIIRFQNMGTGSANNVRIEHITDSKLNLVTLQLLSMSHEGYVSLTDPGVINFVFNNINLPDSTSDEPNSQGYIAFKIKPLDDVIVGDIINGVADIYFDFNSPITTNTVSTEIVEFLNNEDFYSNNIIIYPNPTNSILNLKSESVINKIQVFDMLGRQLQSQEFNQSNAQVNLSTFQDGVYFLRIESNGRTDTRKIIKN